VRSGNSADEPRTYTVEPQKKLSDIWNVAAIGASDYDLSVSGPNGFLRAFRGGVSGRGRANLDVRATYDDEGNGISLVISNETSHAAKVSVLDVYTGERIEHALEPGQSASTDRSLRGMYGWYDLVITVEGDPGFKYRFAGHVETGEDSISDPAMGGVVASS
jgi:phospholipase C